MTPGITVTNENCMYEEIKSKSNSEIIIIITIIIGKTVLFEP
jgi:hypothetical protein